MEKKGAYRRHLYGLSMVLLVLYGTQLVILALGWKLFEQSVGQTRLLSHVIKSSIAIATGTVALLSIRYRKLSMPLLLAAAALFLAMVILLTGFDVDEIDNLLDFAVFLEGLTLYLQILAYTRDNIWQHTLKEKPHALDLRIAGSGELFDPLVMAPHLEMNRNIMDAVDRFLETAERTAPLQLFIHSGEKISPLLQETLTEVLRDHYQDEANRLNRFMERRLDRAMGLILVSIGALHILRKFSGDDSSAIVWIIVSNFAAFSLWQIGATFFENAEAKRQLLRIEIAKNAEIHFM